MVDGIVVLITASSEDEAERISKLLVEERLAACVNIVPVRSIFFWSGMIQNAHESLLIMKTRLPLLEQLITRVKSLHSYTVPEILALPIIGGSDDYLAWLKEMTRG